MRTYTWMYYPLQVVSGTWLFRKYNLMCEIPSRARQNRTKHKIISYAKENYAGAVFGHRAVLFPYRARSFILGEFSYLKRARSSSILYPCTANGKWIVLICLYNDGTHALVPSTHERLPLKIDSIFSYSLIAWKNSNRIYLRTHKGNVIAENRVVLTTESLKKF